MDGDHLPEGAQGEEETHSEVCEGQADDVEVESLTKKKSSTNKEQGQSFIELYREPASEALVCRR